MPVRRRGEPEYEDPREQSFIKKASKMEFGNPVVDALIRVIVLVAMSGGAGYVSSESKNAEVGALKEQLAAAKSENAARWQRYYRQARVERIGNQDHQVCSERRFTRLEAKLRIDAPTCTVHPTGETEP